MSSNTFNGGPAFPVALKSGVHRASGLCGEDIPPNVTKTYGGMTLRDYFAVHASEKDVSAIISAHSEAWVDAGEEGTIIPLLLSRQQARYMHADAMLKEREK